MDLQSILDASDSSSSSEDGYSAAAASSKKLYSLPSRSSNAVDLETLLREDDEDEDEEDDESTQDESAEDDNRDVLLDAAAARLRSRAGETRISSSEKEDWDILQAILHEEEDDDDDDDDTDDDDDDDDEDDTDDDMHIVSRFPRHRDKYWSGAVDTESSASLNKSVDAILQSDDDDEEGDGHDGNEGDQDVVQNMNMIVSNLNNPSPGRTKPWVAASQNTYDGGGGASELSNSRDLDESVVSIPSHTIESRSTSAYTANLNRALNDNSLKASTARARATSDGDATAQAFNIAKTYEKKLLRSGNRDIVSPLMVKRRLKPRVELGTRAQKTNQQRGRGRVLDQNSPTRFNFSGIAEQKLMNGISKAILKHMTPQKAYTATSKEKKHVDMPTAISVNSRFIAVGTQKGIVLVFDLFEVLRVRLGANVDPSADFNANVTGAVTSIDLSATNGEVLVAGYTSGMVVLWDILRGVVLRSVTDTHPSPITCVRFLNELKIVTVDAGGLVNKLIFSRNVIWSNYSIETECLLDGTAGQILAMNVLAPFSTVTQKVLPHSGPLSQFVTSIVLIALSSERSSFAVAVEPTVHVLHRWAKPPQEKITPPNDSDLFTNESYLPCLSWGWALVSGGGHGLTPILARAWGCSVQLLRAVFPSLDEDTSFLSQEQFQWPAFGMHDEFQARAPVVALEWLSERSLVYLTVTNEFTVVDTVMMALVERLDFSGYKLIYAEFSLSRNAPAPQAKEGVQNSGAICATFQNSIRSFDDRLLVLCQSELKSVSVVGAKRRISGLEQDGEWLEALALALDHYEATIESQEDKKRDPDGRKDLSKHPGLDTSPKSEDEEWIGKLLIRYLNIAVENAPESTKSSSRAVTSESMSVDLAHSHFQMLAGVCIEFCVATRRLDLLYGLVFRRFCAVGYIPVFFHILEPYILNEKLKYVAPEVMSYFVEHCRSRDDIATVERCLLHMDVTIVDFDAILALLRSNQMFSALFYVYNQGLDDYVTPLQVLMETVFDAADSGFSFYDRRISGGPIGDFERFGFKAIYYAQQCFRGRSFPHDTELRMPDERVRSLKIDLLRFLLSPTWIKPKKDSQVYGHRGMEYPYLRLLLSVDPVAMLETVSIALDAPDADFASSDSKFESFGGWEVEVDADNVSNDGTQQRSGGGPLVNRQQIVSAIETIAIPEKEEKLSSYQSKSLRSQSLEDAYLDFLAKYLQKGVVRSTKNVTTKILDRMAARYGSAKDPQTKQSTQQQLINLLTALPRNSYEPEEVLLLVRDKGIHRVALLLHQEGASSWHEGIDDVNLRAYHFGCAIDCYLDDADPEFRTEVFDYVKKCASSSRVSREDDDAPILDAVLRTLTSKLSALVRLDPLLSCLLVAELFHDNFDQAIESLQTSGDQETLFMFFQAVESDELEQKDPISSSVLSSHLTVEHHYLFLSLMAQLHPELVYDFLSTHDNYRPEECLKLCQQYEIADASAYLLERMGNVSNALQLILQTLESRMMKLKRTIRGMGTEFFLPRSPHSRARLWQHDTIHGKSGHDKQKKDLVSVKKILVVALDLCERNAIEHSTLWFNTLDRLINAKDSLRLTKEQPGHAKAMAAVISELLRMTMERMVSSVPLTDLVRKVTSDHSGSRLGELREMIQSLLSTYDLDVNVFDRAVEVFHSDMRKLRSDRFDLRCRGLSVKSIYHANTSQVEESARLDVAPNGRTVVVDDAVRHASTSSSSMPTTGFSHTMQRLRSRRTRASTSVNTATRSSFDLRTVLDKEAAAVPIEERADAAVDRLIGQLGKAEHRGRLMSFVF